MQGSPEQMEARWGTLNHTFETEFERGFQLYKKFCALDSPSYFDLDLRSFH